MRRALTLLTLLAPFAAGEVLFVQSDFPAAAARTTEGWRVWSPRPELAPAAFADPTVNRAGAARGGALALAGGGKAAVHGAWERPVAGIRPGGWYRLTAYFRARGLMRPRLEVLARLDWRDADGKRAGQPDYAYQIAAEGDWSRVTLMAPAPENASAALIQLFLSQAPQATVWWDDIQLERIPGPPPRPVRVASLNFRPARTTSPEENVRQFREAAIEAVDKADLIVLPEGVTVVGTGRKPAEVAEPIPGPSTAALGEIARLKKAWLVAGIYEREGATRYNTAVLLDREGRFAGKYRKVYLPREELEGGLTPGNDYPVFDTDFGKLGILICWDVQYADPARALALRGAEILAMPIWGGNTALAKARAIENHVFLAASGYGYPTHILAPDGEELAIARGPREAAIATIDLNRRYAGKWLGHMRGRFFHELRLDVPTAPAPAW